MYNLDLFVSYAGSLLREQSPLLDQVQNLKSLTVTHFWAFFIY